MGTLMVWDLIMSIILVLLYGNNYWWMPSGLLILLYVLDLFESINQDRI